MGILVSNQIVKLSEVKSRSYSCYPSDYITKKRFKILNINKAVKYFRFSKVDIQYWSFDVQTVTGHYCFFEFKTKKEAEEAYNLVYNSLRNERELISVSGSISLEKLMIDKITELNFPLNFPKDENAYT